MNNLTKTNLSLKDIVNIKENHPNASQKELQELIREALIGHGMFSAPAVELSEQLTQLVYSREPEEILEIEEKEKIILSKGDIDYIRHAFEHIDGEVITNEVIYLLAAYAAYARSHPHPKQWIRCDAKDKVKIFKMAGFSKNVSTKKKEYLTQLLHVLYNLDMRVIGSNQPTPCYLFDWQRPVDEEGNELVVISDDSNDSTAIRRFVDALKIENEGGPNR